MSERARSETGAKGGGGARGRGAQPREEARATRGPDVPEGYSLGNMGVLDVRRSQ